MRKTEKTFEIDNSAILYLAQMGKDHTNSYRFSTELPDTVCPELLQQAVDRIWLRFPTILTGFRPEFFTYRSVHAPRPPQVSPDPGLLTTMTRQEIETCVYRVYYSENSVAIEAFHAASDGYGAIMTLRALIAEYLFLRYGCDTPERQTLLESGEPDWETELRDSYLDYSGAEPKGIPGRYSYQLPAKQRDNRVKPTVRVYATENILAAAKNCGVSMTVLLTSLMAEAVMEVQKKNCRSGKEMPVRIMVPIDLRRLFPSKTHRNFILYALPTLEPEEASLPRQKRMELFRHQLRHQVTREWLGPVMARNVRAQQSLAYRMIPRVFKCAAMRTAYRFLGERNSSITVTNLGPVTMSDELAAYVKNIQVFLTPRRHSPYNCSVISCGTYTNICITRFGMEPELEPLFFGKLEELLK